MLDLKTHKEDSINVFAARSHHLIDILQIAEVRRLSEWTVTDYSNELNRLDSIFLVATDEFEEVSGFIVGRHFVDRSVAAESFAEIYNIAIRPGDTRKGIGTKLLNHFVSILSDLQISEVFLEVRSKNTGALEFYRSNRFNISSLRKSYYSNPVDDAIVMRSILYNTSDLAGEMNLKSRCE